MELVFRKVTLQRMVHRNEKDEVTPAPINGVARSGGGRGGFTFSGTNQNANTVPAGDIMGRRQS